MHGGLFIMARFRVIQGLTEKTGNQDKMQNRKLAAILFADIVGYTATMQNNEREGIRRVQQFREVLEENVSQHGGDILQYYGDGCLITFSSGISALQCAMEIQGSLTDENCLRDGKAQVPLRIGIHIGDIVFRNDSIYGDGVNIASRIESLGTPGSVLFSERLIADLKSHPEFKPVSLGAFHFKNVNAPMEVFALANRNLVIPKRSEMKGKLKDNESDSHSKEKAKASIAVLPFTDMSPHKDQEYFADGIAEEILNTISQLKNLKVAGRTSSFSFKNKEATIAEIGETLNVDHILEGSVRKQGGKIRITTQMIKVEDGFHVWSKKYDKNFTDIFDIQDAVAENIATALLEKLAPKQLDKLKGSSIQNSEAYELFLMAKHIFTNKFRASLGEGDFKKSEKLFLTAIELSPDYALAHAGLAHLYDTYIFYALSPSDNLEYNYYNQLRIKESELAFGLDPSSSYINVVKGHISLKTSNELEGAYKDYLRAINISPKNTDVLTALMDIYTRKGLFYDALKFADEALSIDPLHTWSHAWKAYILGVIGDFDSGIKQINVALEINPDEIVLLINLATFYSFLQKNEEALATYEKINQINPNYIVNNPYNQIKIDLLVGNVDLPAAINHQPSAAILPVGNVELDYLSGNSERFKKSFLSWWEAYKLGKSASERSAYYSSNGSVYLHLKNHLMYREFQNKPWFEKILGEEKEKYDNYFSRYERPEYLIR